VQTDLRNELQQFLKYHDVFAGIHYPMPVHLQPAYKGRVICHHDMSVTEKAMNQILSLPIYPELDRSALDLTIELIKNFFK
jgi:dTDP-4-amino-4,6-dideoxygalactose transaminase